MKTERRTIVIIGAGFCGTMMAVRLLNSAAGRIDVVLINRPQPANASANSDAEAKTSPADRAAQERSKSLARGLAYGTNSADHLLNVPAGRMSAFEELPDDFEAYLQRLNLAVDGGSFVARKWYGDYLRSTLDAAALRTSQSQDGPRLITKHATVTDLHRLADGRVQLAVVDEHQEMHLVADSVVLALGNFLPADVRLLDARFYQSANYLRDPWRVGALSRLDLSRPVVLIGTGLTMMDVAATLKRHAVATGKTLSLIAISRRGLLPQPHRLHLDSPTFHGPPSDIFDAATARHYLRSVRRRVDQIEAEGGDWRDVVASLRPITPALWAKLPAFERRRFLRHLRPYWESHRHRAAPGAAAFLQGLIASGELQIRAANFVHVNETGKTITVTIRPRGELQTVDIVAGSVVNCTGPSSNIQAEPLLANMHQQGMIRSDVLSLGLEVADDYRVIDGEGRPVDEIFYVGPLLKARHWEATAVPELRKHVKAAADAVVQSLARSDS